MEKDISQTKRNTLIAKDKINDTYQIIEKCNNEESMKCIYLKIRPLREGKVMITLHASKMRRRIEMVKNFIIEKMNMLLE